MAKTFYIPIGVGGELDPSNYYTKEQVDALIADFITNTVDDLTNYYLKSETYTKDEVQQLVGQITSFEVVATLPVSDIKTNVIYLLGPIGSGADKYEEYVYSNSTWVKIGETSIDLSDYVTTTALQTALADYVTTLALGTVLSDYTPTAQLSTVATSGSYNDLTGTPTLATVATSGQYSDLNGTPTLATVATSGAYADLNGTPTLSTVATSGSYNDLTDKLTAGSGISIGTDNVISATGGGTDNTFELSGEAQSDLADLYSELTTNGRSAGPTTIENWLMDNRVTYYGYPIVSAFVGDYTVDNNGNLAPIGAPRSRDTKAPVQVSDTKVVFGYYPDVRVSGQTVGMKYVLLQSDGTLVTAVDSITITSGGGGGDKEYVYMSTEDSTAEEWEQLYSDLYGDEEEFGWDNMQEWFHTHELFIDDIEIMWDRTEYGYYIFDDNRQLKYDQNEEEQVIVLFGGLELWNNAEIEGLGMSNIYYYAYILHEDGTVDEGGDTLSTKPVVDLYNCPTETREAIYNWMMDNTPEDYIMFHAVYYYGRPATMAFTGYYVIENGKLVENSDPDPEDVVVFKIDTRLCGVFGDESSVATEYVVLSSDGTIEIAVNEIVLADVALSGSYNDLADKLTAGSGVTISTTNVISVTGGGGQQVQSDWTEISTVSPAYIQNKPTLSTVATSGSYSDLTNQPTILGVGTVTLNFVVDGIGTVTYDVVVNNSI